MLANDNDYTGATTINSGTLLLGSSNAVHNSTVGINQSNVLGFLPGVGTFKLGGLSGTGALSLSDTAGGVVNVAVGASGASSTFSARSPARKRDAKWHRDVHADLRQ